MLFLELFFLTVESLSSCACWHSPEIKNAFLVAESETGGILPQKDVNFALSCLGTILCGTCLLEATMYVVVELCMILPPVSCSSWTGQAKPETRSSALGNGRASVATSGG